MTGTLVPLLLTAGVLLVLVAGVAVAVAGRRGDYTYRARGPLLSKAETAFFLAFERALRGECRVFTKVRIADLVAVRPGGERRANLVAFNRIAAKHVDFVLADPATLLPVAAVELDDASHDRRDRMRRDAFVEKVFAAAGIPLLRFRARGRYDVGELRRQLEAVLPPAGSSRADG